MDILAHKPLRLCAYLCVAMLPLMFSCDDYSMDEEEGSIFGVQALHGMYGGAPTNQVDILWNPEPCTTGEREYFSDHFGSVTFTNRTPPDAIAPKVSSVFVTHYSVRYEPVTPDSPPLDPMHMVPLGSALEVLPDEEASATLEVFYVPVATKEILLHYYEQTCVDCQFQYNIYFTFYGTDGFGNSVAARAADTFYVANYDYCAFTPPPN